MDALSVLAIAMQCVTAAPAPVVAALALAETQGATYAVTANGDRSDHASLDLAVKSVALALHYETHVKVGMAGIPVDAFSDRDASYTEGFSPCRNLAIAGEELRQRFEEFGGQDDHWRLAVLDYGTGEPGFDGEYASRFDEALAEVSAMTEEIGSQNAADSAPDAEAAAREPLPASSSADAQRSSGSQPHWDVYGRDQSRSLLIFSR